jgi:alcohol dehydrogenase (cytochrome c)
MNDARLRAPQAACAESENWTVLWPSGSDRVYENDRYYQFTPHDIHDWDSTQVPVLGELTIAGQPRKVVMLANGNGFFYVLDRESGKRLLGKPFTGTRWAREIGPDGRPVVLNNAGTRENCLPDQRGGTNFMPPSFDPVRRLFYVTASETCVAWESIRPPNSRERRREPGNSDKKTPKHE